MEWMNEDELTDSDLEFLKALEESAKQDINPGAPYVDPESKSEDGEDKGDDDDRRSDIKDDDDFDARADDDDPNIEYGESDEVDESKMDISNVEPQPEPESSPKSDEPDHLEGGDDEDSEIRDGESDLEYEPEAVPEPKADAEEPSKDFDAQKELEDHLSDVKSGEDESEREEGAYDAVPEAGPRCTNHCEDNLPEDDEPEECPHCRERIRIEREQWGAVATDMHGNPLLPGDAVRVVVAHPMMQSGSELRVNVPNMDVEEPRYVESTAGEHRLELCWLSGRGISMFTGWHMIGASNPVWKFAKGKQINFVEKIGQPEFDDLDPDEMIEDFMKDLDEHGKSDEEEKPEVEERAENDEESKVGERAEPPESPDDEERADDPDEPDSYEHDDDDEEPYDLREKREKKERARKDELTQAQHDRFDNLVDRIDKKIESTFGGTMESHASGEPNHNHVSADQTIVIVSRGVEYTIQFKAVRHGDSKSDEAA